MQQNQHAQQEVMPEQSTARSQRAYFASDIPQSFGSLYSYCCCSPPTLCFSLFNHFPEPIALWGLELCVCVYAVVCDFMRVCLCINICLQRLYYLLVPYAFVPLCFLLGSYQMLWA